MLSKEVKEWYDRGNFLHYNNYRIFNHRDSAGNDILIIHGYPFSSYQWKDLIAKLSDNFRVTIIDLLRFGFSDKPTKHKYSILEYFYIINYSLKKLKIKSTHLLCHYPRHEKIMIHNKNLLKKFKYKWSITLNFHLMLLIRK